MHARSRTVTCLIGVLLAATLVSQPPALATPGSQLARSKVRFTCLSAGGASATLWIRNVNEKTVTIEDEVILLLTIVRETGPERGPVLFMFPIPELATIRPGAVSRFSVPIGDGEEGEPGSDFSGIRLRLTVAVFFVGHNHPSVSHFRLQSCPPPV